MAANEAESPSDISFESVVVDICCHPSKHVIASGNIDGEIAVHSYSVTEKNHHLMTLSHHKKPCRAVEFTPDGTTLITTSKDKSICKVDMEKGVLSHRIKKAHESPLYCLLAVDNNMVGSGDDDGHLKVWDLRQNKAVMEVKENDEFISDMVMDNTNRYMLATSGDGTLTCYDIRKHKMKMQSELFDSEMLSLALMKGDEKIVVGTGEGVLNIFNWGEWGNISDRFPGHPLSIDCIVPINDSIICTGSFDGVVRAVHVLPNRFLGVVGEHKDFPVENLSLSHCGKYLASCSHDQTIKFWNVEHLDQETVSTHRKKAKKNNKPRPLNRDASKSDFFADLTAAPAAVSDAPDAGGSKDNNAAAECDDDSSDDSDDESGAEMSGGKSQNQKKLHNAAESDDEDSDDESLDEDIEEQIGGDVSDSSSSDDD